MHSGLFTLHFTPVCAADEEKVAASGSMSASTQNSAEFGDWHILLRFAVENEVLSVRPQGKIFAMGGECGTNSSSEEPVVIPGLGRVPRPVKDRQVSVVMRCHCHWQYTEAFRFDVCFDKLEGVVVGMKGTPLNDVTISCEGSQAYGWYIGEATVRVEGKPFVLPHRLRFVLDPYVGAQCTMCLDPVYAQGYTCTECGAVEYCSQKCQAAHMIGGHGLLCPILRRTYTQRSGKVLTETEKGTELVAWWRCLENACYSILVDFHNSLGQPIEFFLCTLKPAQEEGLRYRFIVREGSTPRAVKQEELVEFACTVFRAVSENSISEGCTSLAAACLNYIFVFSRHIESIVESHVLYYYSYLCEDFEGTICSVEEYVTYARPMHELGIALIEFALKSPTALLFWQRIKLAKNVFINLYNVNTSCHCSKIKELVTAIPGQQRETLSLLSKVFLIMASRAPKKEGLRLLEQAEKCLRDCLPTEQEADTAATAMDAAESQRNNRFEDSDVLDDNLEEMDPSCLAILYFRLSTLLLLYDDANKTREAEVLKAQGDALIAKTKQTLAENSATK
ncbi:hypothetical protein TraAM80_00501 [Trypanosoma rangeli]|uniref:MYND-type domain-containing protein n=1 Tax=Trypanosoma rangeli TaxID=5698 RepID=A0A3R7P3B0_TRYRA|nr:uncharacterized protein TraAM80_00501 [Trypanosoma rangeli]RNF12084.1 hypothetical protein TraAM80_00501 [Trypanosoma rangeli]|eukprot:RNF12084.1 hypothetical protein TraAM80_00501 [Trypanosoma rangeli]